jgi:hypothetical protein
MAKIIPLSVRRSRLPLRVLRDGWWLETPTARSKIIALPKRNAPRPNPSAEIRHLTLITSEK